MSRKHVKTIQSLTAQTLEEAFTTDWYSISQLDNAGILIDCNSVTDNTGTFAVEVRMLANGVYSSECEITLSSVPTLADEDTEFFLDLSQLPANEFRLKFTPSAGTPDGTCEVFVHTKSVGA